MQIWMCTLHVLPISRGYHLFAVTVALNESRDVN